MVKDISGYRWYIGFLVRYEGKIESFRMNSEASKNDFLNKYGNKELVREYVDDLDVNKSIKIYEDSSIHYIDTVKKLVIVLVA